MRSIQAPRPGFAACLIGVLLAAGCATSPATPPATPPAVLSAAPATPAVKPAAALAASPPAQPASGPAVRPAAAGAAGSAPAAATPPAPASGLPAFATVVKDAKRIDGPIKAWQKDDKLWFELAPADFGKPLLLSPKLSTGIGQTPIVGGMMSYPVSGAGGAQLFEFVKLHNTVRLLARNTEVTATPGTPEARALADSYSPSLLGSAALASQPHPQSQAVLIEANGIFLSDLLGTAMLLQRTFRQGYSLDARNSVITSVRGSAQSLEIETQNHYYTSSLSTVQPGAPPGGAVPALPLFVPDTRSLFVGHHYSIGALPAQPMRTRRADARIGLMTQTVLDFGDDLARTPRVRLVERWRLEKADPAAERSAPVEPITFWIDRNVPLKYREVVREAILEWNKAFERIGFDGAIVAQQQPDDAAFATLDFGRASVRWMMSAEPGFGAVGPKHVDPRTGEILDADIGFESLSSRSQRSLRQQTLSGAAAFAAVLGGGAADARAGCLHADLAAEQLAYALDVLEARGELDPEGAATEQFVRDYVKETIMHEVGHALGLRHNFRASRLYTEAQLGDLAFTREHGTSGSVMEYNAINLPRPGERGGLPFHTTLGPYDHWAIEYAYRPLAAEQEGAELQRIAARSAEPELAFGSDDDASVGIDPETIQLDLGADPIAYAGKRLEIARDLFRRQETRALPPDQGYAVLRRSLSFAIADAGRASGVLVRQVGGLRTLRDHPGSGRDPLQPAPAKVQRDALDLLGRYLLSLDGLSVSPALQRRLAPDFADRNDFPSLPTDFAVAQRLLDLQRIVLAQLMSDTLAARVLDNVDKSDRPVAAFQLAELYERIDRDVWTELATGARIGSERRELQRDHVNRLAAVVLRPPAAMRADARALQRLQATRLLAQMERTLKRGTALDEPSRMHLRDCADTLRQALSAQTTRIG